MAHYETPVGKTVHTGRGLIAGTWSCNGCGKWRSVGHSKVQAEAARHAATCRRTR